MAVQGNLKDISLTGLIQLNCNEASRARLRIINQQREGVLFFDGGNVVHATLAGREGEVVVYELLTWAEGAFILEPDIPSPKRTIETPWSALLLEGMNRIDQDGSAPTSVRMVAQTPVVAADSEPQPLFEPELVARQMLVTHLQQTEGIEGAVLVSRDGVVLAHALNGNPEREGAATVFVGSAAHQIGQALELGTFQSAVIEMGAARKRLVVLDQPDYYVGLLLQEQASPALVLQRVSSMLP